MNKIITNLMKFLLLNGILFSNIIPENYSVSALSFIKMILIQSADLNLIYKEYELKRELSK